MDYTEEEETLRLSPIPRDILALPAREVLSYSKIRDPLSLQLNMEGALKNWKDVADMLGYSAEKILGYFAHNPRPGLLLLEDWIYKRNGILEKLVNILSELEFYSSQDVICECVEDYQRKLSNDDDGIGDVQGIQLDDGGCCMIEEISIVSTTNSDCTDRTSYTSSEYSTTPSPLPSTVVKLKDKSYTGKIGGIGSYSSKCDRELQEKSRSSTNLQVPSRGAEGATTAGKPGLFRYSSWSPDTHLENEDLLQSNQGEKDYMRSNSHEPKSKLKDRKKSFRKKIARMFSTKRHKRSSEPSNSEGKSSFVSSGESSVDTSMVTSFTASYSYSESVQNPKENLSPLKVKEARRLSNSDSVSSRESAASPTSPGYESGYTSSPEAPTGSGKTISIIHCSQLEGNAFEGEVSKLYYHFSKNLGYKCHLDKVELVKVAENMFRWAVKSVQQSDFVFICVSPQLKRIFDSPHEEISGSLEDDEACMVRLESDLILAELATNASNRKGKYMTIVLEGSSKRDVPGFLNLYLKYRWPDDERRIRCIIEGLPEIIPVPVSSVKTDPPPKVVEPAKIPS